MMAFTHALLGALLAVPLAVAAPELAPVALVAGFAGGVVPDLDIYAGHRRTLHYPVYTHVAALPALAGAALAPGPLTVGLAWFLLAAGLHAAMDVLGGGLELRPWQATSDRGVYSHYHDRWLAPRRWVAYDGSAGDLLLAVGAGTALTATFGPVVDAGVVAVLVAAAGYSLARRHLADLWATLAAALPAPVAGRLPERFADL